MKLKKYIGCIGLFLVSTILLSCAKFLDSKPSAKDVIPKKVSDLRAMMDNVGHINIYTINPYLEHYSDYLRVDEVDLNKLSWINMEFYTFGQNYESDQVLLNAWSSGYRPVFIANNVFELLPNVSGNSTEEGQWVKGTAHFLRANYMFHLVKVFSPMYIKGNELANAKLSIPLRLASDVTAVSSRSTVKEVYQHMVKDFQAAIQLLPVREQYTTRPDKASAYACLSRLYLSMQEFELAGKYADSSLRIYDVLMDYNTIDRNLDAPFPKQNKETLFYAASLSMDFLNPKNGSYIDSDFVDSYDQDDLRKEAYYTLSSTGEYQFKGNYTGENYGAVLPDPAVDEMYFTRAEAYARTGKATEAMESLNQLMLKRWRTGKFQPFTASNADQALRIILEERKKSLVFRGVRILDQRRLNLEPAFAKPVIRTLGIGANRQEFRLEANDLRYIFLLPQDLISITKMPQSER